MLLLQCLKETIYSLINDWIFDETEIEALIYESLCEHLRTDELGSSYVEYELINNLEPEQLEYIESEEKGSTDEGDILAVTIADDPKVFKTVFVVDKIKQFIQYSNPFEARRKIKDIAKHEAFHVRQYNYMIKNGGMDAIGRLRDYMITEHYDNNILEKGAYDYQYFNEEQDFTVFDKFIWPERFVKRRLHGRKII